MSGRPTQRYLAVPGSSAPSNIVTAFWNDQVINPEYRAGNLNILLGVTTFAAGVFAVRNFGGILIPGF
ncbi:hypothetical protein QFC21_003794 [Naganishia friedmannii]|uniref:Uncharacterized protein n=1 Tax=Naganishia friedmannii TaxID=89922 RepID=A0ACC2VLZ6_9TREE|nr:hypothetical protein QFC21_003794 [Naganishia friedmannii]